MKFNKTKLLSITLLLLLNVVNTFSQENILDKKISIIFDNISIKEALKQIEAQSSASFAYNDSETLNQQISISFQQQKINKILTELFKNTNLNFKVVAGKISIYNEGKKGGEQTIHGYTCDKNTGEALIGASIYNPQTMTGTVTNQFGFFSLSLQPGDYDLVISFIGYKNQKIKFSESKSMAINLEPISSSIGEVLVHAKGSRDFISASSLGVMGIESKSISKIPAVGGEPDLLKAITMLPGIKQGTDGSAGVYVRGGGPDQNLILLDGVPLYNPYHLWGYLSTFNADAINNVEITKGAFPARYGGRLSSVIDVNMNNGNNQKWEKKISVGLLSGKASVSGPLKKDKSSLFLSVRRTYADLILAPIYALSKNLNGSKTRTGYNFTDLNMKTNYRFSDENSLYLSAYYSKDKLYDNKIESGDSPISYKDKTIHNEGWGNAILALRWNHLFSDKLFVNTTAYYTGYNYYTLDEEKVSSDNSTEIPEFKNTTEYYSRINDFSLKQDYQYFLNNRHNIKFGAGIISHKYEPGVNTFSNRTAQDEITNKDANASIRATEMSIYIEDDYDVFPFLKINGGIHTSGFRVQGKNYLAIEPRISGRLKITRNLSLKAGYSEMSQYQHLLTTSSLTQSSDLWIPATKNILPQYATQYSGGIAWSLKNIYQVELEGYHKKLDHLVAYKEGYEIMDENLSWEEKVTVGNGESYGGEILIRKTQGRLTGWVGYTLSWTNRQFNEINNGIEYPYKFDRRHDISLVGNYKLNEKWDLNMNWVYYSGMMITAPNSTYLNPYYTGRNIFWTEFITPNDVDFVYYTSGLTSEIEGRNNYKLPDYHKLDITATYHKETKHGNKMELTFGLTNAYNRMNPSYYLPVEPDESSYQSNKVKYEMVTLFPMMPTFTYSLTF